MSKRSTVRRTAALLSGSLALLLALIMALGCLPVFAASSGKQVESAEDLEGSRIGVQMGTVSDIYVSDFEGDEAGTEITRFSSNNDAVEALKQGKIDCFVLDEQPALAFAENNPTLRILDEEFSLEDYAIVVAKGNDQLLADINSALAEVKAEGTLEKILDTYINKKGDFHYKQTVTDGEPLVMATNATFPPYEYYEGSTPVGIDVEMSYAIADKLGRTITIEDMDFDAIINSVSSGKADIGVAGFTVTEERKQAVNFSDSYVTCKQVIMVNDENADGDGASLGDKFYRNFIKDSRWAFLAKGLAATLLITLFAAIIGVVLGFLIALVRTSHDLNGSLPILNTLCKVYLAVIRGTPVMVQLLIIYYVIFASVNINKILVAIVAFGINSAAYVAEIVRSGIMSIDPGQLEAGRSLGLKFPRVMLSVIMPQAVKNITPALLNEFISLLKETSISGYIGLADLTRGGMIIRSITYDSFLPLIAVALTYLVIVLLLTKVVSYLERRMSVNER